MAKPAESYTCKCTKCGARFASFELVKLAKTTGDKWNELVSPCCHAGYEGA